MGNVIHVNLIINCTRLIMVIKKRVNNIIKKKVFIMIMIIKKKVLTMIMTVLNQASVVMIATILLNGILIINLW